MSDRQMPTTPPIRRRWIEFGIAFCVLTAGCGRHDEPPVPLPEPSQEVEPQLSQEEMQWRIKKAIEYLDGTRSGHQFVNLTLISILQLERIGPAAKDALPALEKFVRGESKYRPEPDEKAAAEKAITKIKAEGPKNRETINAK